MCVIRWRPASKWGFTPSRSAIPLPGRRINCSTGLPRFMAILPSMAFWCSCPCRRI
ncbi:Uncharacterised protein [Bordetella pertussis]|nr:Uncharacterised protein [Bordetella pertussis]